MKIDVSLMPMFTDEQKKQHLIGFLDFLLDSSQRPERNVPHNQELRKAQRYTTRALEALEKARQHDRDNHLLQSAEERLREAISRFEQQVARHRYESPNLTLEEKPQLGNIEADRRLFVAYLIFKRARSNGQLRAALCASGSAKDCMTEYASGRGFYASRDALSKTIDRYKKKPDWPAGKVVSILYSHYVWVAMGQRGYSDDEKNMLLELTSKPGKSCGEPVKRRK